MMEFDPRFWMFDLIQEGIRFEDMSAGEIALYLIRNESVFGYTVLERVVSSHGLTSELRDFDFKCEPVKAHANHWVVTWERKKPNKGTINPFKPFE